MRKCNANKKLVKLQNAINRDQFDQGSFVCLERQLTGIKESLPSL